MNGKAKEAFKKFCYENDYTLFIENEKYKDLEIMNNALIIEFLDSVGIHVTVSYWSITNKWQDLILGFYNGSFEHNTRQEATEAAIKKAVEIYNARFS
ncbi:hypothetical protein HZQ67_13970 [Elizabethkingia anophelis]|nr:hypothetical protein [Elizabethkingia anophelis]